VRGVGRERIINALLSAPKVSAASFFLLLPDIDRREQKKQAYQIYITDALKIIGGLNIRYVDMLKPQAVEESPEEIIERMKRDINGTEE
jgi:hypothetical protein